jgi:hypothetical protein
MVRQAVSLERRKPWIAKSLMSLSKSSSGLGLPMRVDNVMKAYTLLNEWPPSKRNAAHAIALNACRAALVGEIDTETARATFIAFARRASLLAPQVEGVIATQASGPKGKELHA